MIEAVQTAIDGLAVGSAYALLAIGFTLVFGVLRRLNLAYGPSILIGAFAGTYVFVQAKAELWAVAAATVAGTVLIGAYVERLCFWSIRRGAAIASMVSSYAIWMQLEEATALAFPARTYRFPALFDGAPLALGPVTVRADHLVMFAVAAAVALALHLFLKHGRYGAAIRAAAENPEAARHLGLPAGRIGFVVFAIASAIGGVAGFLISAANEQVTTHYGLTLTFKGLIAMMLGGMGSLAGAVVGGLALGLAELGAKALWGAPYHDLAGFVLLFAVLVVRPGGLVGQGRARREAAALARV
jgi:branched-chain amino acid transport system permease protein